MKKYLTAGLLVGLLVSLGAQGSGIPNSLRVKIDAAGALVTASVAQTLPLSQPTVFTNTRLKTDASGNLLVTIASGPASITTLTTNKIVMDIANQDINIYRTAAKTLKIDTDGVGGALTSIALVGQLDLSGNLNFAGSNNIAFQGSSSLTITANRTLTFNGYSLTAANALPGWTHTGTLNTSGTNFDAFSIVITDTAHGAGTKLFNIYGGASGTTSEFSVDTAGAANAISYALGGTSYLTGTGGGNMTLNGFFTAVPLTAGGIIQWNGSSAIKTTAQKLVQIGDNGVTTALELNAGTPTLGTCTGGTLVSGSHNFGGEVTGTTGGSCVINFGAPNYTNTPFCTVIDESATPTAINITAKSNASVTFGNISSGHNISFLCNGRIGT